MKPNDTILKDVLILVAPLTDYPDSSPYSRTPDFESIRIVTPIDALYTYGNLLKKGFSVDIFNVGLSVGYSNRRNQFRLYAAEHKYRAIIVLPPILTFATAQDFTGEDFIGILRESNVETIAIVGGTYPTNFPGKLVALKKCDFELVGEFENSVTKLLETLRDSNYDVNLCTSITGVISARRSLDASRKNTIFEYDTVSLGSLPVIDYRWLGNDFLEKYSAVVERGKIRFPEKSPYYIDIMTSRGCTLRCSFCSVSHFRGNNI